jgi:hypothetical protein
VGAGAIKALLRVVAAAGIPGIIAGSIAENDAVAITFGSITVVAAIGLILVTAATATATRSEDHLGGAVEDRVRSLVAAGADESAVRALVGDAVRLGQRRQGL